jgi:error-prone DNA polymerase
MATGAEAPLPGFAELYCLSSFSFQRGASQPEELVQRAQALGYSALAITDECTMAGAVRALAAAEACGLKLLHGTELRCTDGLTLVLLAQNLSGYQQICRLISLGRSRAPKGQYRLERSDLSLPLDDTLVLWIAPPAARDADAAWLTRQFPGRAWIAHGRFLEADDAVRLHHLQVLSQRSGLPLVAANAVHLHVRERQRLQDVLTAVRHGCTVQAAGTRLFANGERHLRSLETLLRLYPQPLLDETLNVAARCHFSLRQIQYDYPHELTRGGLDATQYLRRLVDKGLRRRYPVGPPAKVRATVEKELALIAELKYEHFFLTVENLVRYARRRGILCQGRGSAANSAVCYALGITEVNPQNTELLFERFISKERHEAPDIDVDFEHERREEVIQYVYRKYGRERAALAATVIRYRRDSAIRDVGKALGFSEGQLTALTQSLAWWDDRAMLERQCQALGFSTEAPLLQQLFDCVTELEGFPRHLSQHVGGFVIADAPLWSLVPIEPAAMEARSVIQWDKEDLEELGLLKVDCLALGMLTALHRMLDLLSLRDRRSWSLGSIPREDPDAYAMISRADTIGVFQIESRAQMSMLPRLRPQCFYDLVIQVAIVRPGPIQGGMVHPYLQRRKNPQLVEYPSPELREVLERTLGVPLFQEQVMQIVIVAANFTPGEADQVRRSMAAWTRKGGLEHFRERLMSGMRANGYNEAFCEQIYQQILGFGSYGFPESHSASFAILTYFSCWLKCHEPAAFLAGLLNAQPLGFYAPAQLINDARRSKPQCPDGVEVRPIDALHSGWLSTLEPGKQGRDAVRLGLSLIRGLSATEGARIEHWRRTRDPAMPLSVAALADGARLSAKACKALAEAGALASLAGHRHTARWQVSGIERLPGLLAGHAAAEPELPLPTPSEAQDILADYAAIGLSLRRHPLALLRSRLDKLGVCPAAGLALLPTGRKARVAGIVTHRQRPGTASGVVFGTLEDETGSANLIFWPRVLEAYRLPILGATLMLVHGRVQNEDEVCNLIAEEVFDYSAWLGQLQPASRDFH